MDFRDRLLLTLRDFGPVLSENVMVCGSEVPNLLAGQASAVIVSEDVDIAVPIESHAAVKGRLVEVRGFAPMPEEPSVWVPDPELRALRIEVNFVGLDARLADASQSYVIEDADLPLMVFGNLGLLRPGERVVVEGIEIPLPDVASLAVEKLLTDRSGIKGDRDLLVVLGLLQAPRGMPLDPFLGLVATLDADQRHAIRSNLVLLSLIEGHPGMPDPASGRSQIAALLTAVEELDE